MFEALSTSHYQSCLQTILDLNQQAHQQAQTTLRVIRLQLYWHIGQQIHTLMKKNKLTDSSTTQFMQELSADLTTQLGKGFSARNLWYMHEFYAAYPKLPTSVQEPAQISWGHYQILSTISLKSDRREMTKLITTKNLTTLDLRQILKTRNVPLKHQTTPKQLLTTKNTSVPPKKLTINRGALHTYRLITDEAAPNPNKLFIDCGFHISRDVPLRGIRSPYVKEIVQASTKNGLITFKHSDLKPSSLFTYIATIKKVVDGDTLRCRINCDFGTFSNMYLRLRHINAPERGSIKGHEAKAFVTAQLAPCPFVIIKTTTTIDIYGRYVADIFYLPNSNDPQDVLKNGHYLNQILLNQGLATLWE